MIMQGCVISCGRVVFFQKARNLSRSLLTNNNFYCGYVEDQCHNMHLCKKENAKRKTRYRYKMKIEKFISSTARVALAS